MRRKRRKPQTITELFDQEQYADKELIDIFQLWILRVYFKLTGIKHFFSNYNGFENDNIAHFLDLDQYIDQDWDKLDQTIVVMILKEKYLELENKIFFTPNKTFNKTLDKNIQKISKLMHLNKYEEEILRFTILQKEYDILRDATDQLGSDLNASHTKKALSNILNIPLKEVEKCFTPGSKFSKSSLITIDHFTRNLDRKIEFITDSFSSIMLSTDESVEYMLKEVVYKCEQSELSLKDFDHIEKELSILLPYLKSSVDNNTKGVNILLYGLPGTGKTEVTKAISNKLDQILYEISYTDANDEPIEGKNRLKAYKSAQTLLSNKNTILMFDEVEDVFNNDDGFFSKRQKNKAWINRILENNSIPTIWITNNVHSIDNAIIRRFDMSIEIPIPSKTKRKEILDKFSYNQLSSETISKLAVNDTVAPALVSRAAKVVSSLGEEENKDRAFEMIIDNTLKAQGYDGIQNSQCSYLPKTYNPTYINSDVNLEKLTNGIKESQNARICLYGPAGTGKSAYGKYLSQVLDKPLLLKKGSDLISMWVGETEKNIARAFKEAREENAILIFDEVDSFLADRSSATKNWEVTQVNEMLVQMESFDGIFVATTNLMNNLDKASLRRFDLKLQFSFLKSEQAWRLFRSECKDMGFARVSNSLRKSIDTLNFLTPGDFAAVIRQNRFQPLEGPNDFFKRLENEVAVKDVYLNKKMGFL